MNTLSYRSHVDLAIKHYSSLFRLPTLKLTLASSVLTCLSLGLAVSFTRGSVPFIRQVLEGLVFGAALFIATSSIDYFSVKLLHRKDIILGSFRRLSFLSFLSNLLFAVFVGFGDMLMLLYPDGIVLLKMLSLCFFITFSLRLLIIYTISFSRASSRIASSLLQPLTTLILLTRFQEEIFRILLYNCLHLILPLILSLVNVPLFILLLNRDGLKRLGIPSLKIFRAFLANWTEDYEEPFEEVLEQISEERDVMVSMLLFRGRDHGNMKAIIIVPNIHPGPFKNIGSSPLPSLIKDYVEKEYMCVVSVPHGISGHELDLPSQRENMKVINGVIIALKEPKNFTDEATKFFFVERGGAKVGCQIFGNCALLTLTMSPTPMEDLPPELKEAITQKALEEGFSWAIIIDAHNSINGPPDMRGAIGALKDAANMALRGARGLMRLRGSMRVGAGHVSPEGVGLREGIGPGGITAVVVDVGGQRTAYVTIDGNNMVSGLREKILLRLRDLGVDCGEVFTTDTHIVNAVVLSKRGYRPIGEAMDHEELIGYVRRAVSEALENMELAEAAWCRLVIPRIKVIGERKIGELSMLVDKVSKKAKKYSTSFAASFFLLLLLLAAI